MSPPIAGDKVTRKNPLKVCNNYNSRKENRERRTRVRRTRINRTSLTSQSVFSFDKKCWWTKSMTF